MSLTKKKILLNVFCTLSVALAALTLYGFKIGRVFTFNLGYFWIFLVLFLLSAALSVSFYFNKNCKKDFLRPNILLLVVILAATCLFSDYITGFSFEKWENKEYLRQFMADDFFDTQAFHKDNEFFLDKYTREQTRELLNTGSQKDRPPEITYEFADSIKTYSADIYYGFKALNGKEYWLVITYMGDENSTKDNYAGMYYFPSGTRYILGKSNNNV